MTHRRRLFLTLTHPSNGPIVLLGAIFGIAAVAFGWTWTSSAISAYHLHHHKAITGTQAEAFLLETAKPGDFEDPRFLARLERARRVGDQPYYANQTRPWLDAPQPQADATPAARAPSLTTPSATVPSPGTLTRAELDTEVREN